MIYRALNSLFSTLRDYGATYPVQFWDTVCQELLFPIFAVLKSSQDVSRFSTQEDMSVWLSTTMIQALRDLISLYTFYFVTLERFLDGLLDLLCVCICQGMPSVFLSDPSKPKFSTQRTIPWHVSAHPACSNCLRITQRK
jgi:brefeldin A-inhibited guanine nucleotide-exchange protein